MTGGSPRYRQLGKLKFHAEQQQRYADAATPGNEFLNEVVSEYGELVRQYGAVIANLQTAIRAYETLLDEFGDGAVTEVLSFVSRLEEIVSKAE